MFVISLSINLFCRIFNPFNSLATYFPNSSYSLSPFSFFIKVSVNFWRISVFEEGASAILCRLTSGLRNQWQLFSCANTCCFRFKLYRDDLFCSLKELLFWTFISLEMSRPISLIFCLTGPLAFISYSLFWRLPLLLLSCTKFSNQLRKRFSRMSFSTFINFSTSVSDLF